MLYGWKEVQEELYFIRPPSSQHQRPESLMEISHIPQNEEYDYDDHSDEEHIECER